MIFPDLVFGRSAVKTTISGFAIAPIFLPTWSRTSLSSSSVPSYPCLSVTNAAIDWPLMS